MFLRQPDVSAAVSSTRNSSASGAHRRSELPFYEGGGSSANVGAALATVVKVKHSEIGPVLRIT